MSLVFELKSASLRYKDIDVLSNINLLINAGEHVALLGKSGAGKSTLLNTLYQQQQAGCALVPQNVALVEALSVFHNVYMGQLNQHNTLFNLLNLFWPQRKPVEEVRQLLKLVELDEILFSRTGELSGGQKQRVAIARALFQGNQVLLGDEPISALDSVLARKVMQLLHQRHETVVLAMHDVDMALCFADRIIGIKNGSIAIDQPANSVTAADLQFLYIS
ncbi:MAG: phosphonate ABC transporter ATP-binding protein [Gammaproteobacteria bacterium]